MHLKFVDEFDKALKTLGDTLKGEARLESWDGDFVLSIRCVGDTGHLLAEVSMSERWGNEDEFELRFNIPLDQSHIPAFRGEMAKHFPRATT